LSRCTSILQSREPSELYELTSLVDEAGVLTLNLSSADGFNTQVVFDDCLAHRKIDEGDAFVTLSELARQGCLGGTFYRVDDSESLRWFRSESYGVRDTQDLVHYLLMTLNDVVDVIAISEPAIYGQD
jgi:hypothetical protein